MELLFAQQGESEAALQGRVDLAKALGHKEILVLGAGEAKLTGAKRAALVTQAKDAARLGKQHEALLAAPRRDLVENKHVTHILEPETSDRKEHTHYRRSGLTQVELKLCAASGKRIITTLRILAGSERAVRLGRMMQNARWCRKLGVDYVVASGATTAWEQRSAGDLKAFLRMLLKR